MTTSRQRHLLLSEHLNPVPDHIDPAVIGGVQLEHGVPETGAEKVFGEAEDGRGLPDPRRSRDDDIGHIPIPGEHAESAHCLLIADNLME